MKSLLLVLAVFFCSLNANACSLHTLYWPVPSGYTSGSLNLNKIVEGQYSWGGASVKSIKIDSSVDAIRKNIHEVVGHYSYLRYLPDILKDLPLKDFELISLKVEPILGNNFHDFEGNLVMNLGYFLPEVSIESAENKWIMILEYKFTFATPDGRKLFWKAEILTLTDGTILYEYPGMGSCG